VPGVTGSHDTPVSELDGSVTRRFLLSPEVRNNRKGGLNDHKVSARSTDRETHRTYHHNFRSLLLVNGGTKVKPIERGSRSALLLLVIERRSRLQGFCATAVANDRTEASVDDWTEEPVGNQGIAIGRTSRSAIKGRGLDGSRAFFCCYRSNGRVGRCLLLQGRTGEARRLRVRDDQLRVHDDRSGRFDGG
jgi:hypothetical protein